HSFIFFYSFTLHDSLPIFIINLSRSLLPCLIHRIVRSQETLFIFSLAWVFGISALVSSAWIGFSIEIGGFLAGIALANSVENFQIGRHRLNSSHLVISYAV